MASPGRVRRPKVILVDGVRLPVTWRKLGQFAQGYALGGYYYPKARGGPRISITAFGSRNTQRVALVHEVLHDVWRRAGLHLRFKTTTEELVIDELSSWFVRVLRDNPQLVRYLTEED